MRFASIFGKWSCVVPSSNWSSDCEHYCSHFTFTMFDGSVEQLAVYGRNLGTARMSHATILVVLRKTDFFNSHRPLDHLFWAQIAPGLFASWNRLDSQNWLLEFIAWAPTFLRSSSFSFFANLVDSYDFNSGMIEIASLVIKHSLISLFPPCYPSVHLSFSTSLFTHHPYTMITHRKS